MAELRPAQKHPKAKKLTREAVRKNPLIRMLARIRLKEIRAAKQAKKATELDF